MSWDMIQIIVQGAFTIWALLTIPFIYANTPLDKFMFKSVPAMFAIYFAFSVFSAIKDYLG